MPLSEVMLPHHSPVTPTTSSSSSTVMSSTMDEPTSEVPPYLKSNFISWRIIGGFFATALVVGWVFIIVILIQEEKWQLVLVSWLLLYAAAHFCYWYFKRHHLLSLDSQICRRVRGNVGSVSPIEKNPDAPPSYEDIIKSEPPPPTYYSVVAETPKSSLKSSTTGKFSLPLHGLPRVFGRHASSPSSVSPSSTESASVSSSSLSSPQSLKSQGILYPCTCMANSISGGITTKPNNWTPTDHPMGPLRISPARPPPYKNSYVDVEAQVDSQRSISPSSTSSSNSREEESISETIRPILSPLYSNVYTLNDSESPSTSQDITPKKLSSSSTSNTPNSLDS